ncbi:SAV_2336 N-terminal domain-related protein [Actinoplanes sp. NPDC051346]|uniref:SAV_2336 N-terminal domain-related protein n=1 Tax=Actinoplanes sp. NPDC051346 TaxID=3155048 RepID=UPI0034487121
MSSTLLTPVVRAVGELLSSADLGWEPSADDICDALWLARHLPAGRLASRTAPGEPPAARTPEGRAALPAASGAPAQDTTFDEVFPQDRSGNSTLHRAGQPLALPPVRPLPDSLAIGRALRPLRIRRPSRTRHTVDEAATAEQAARSGVWQPILRPRQERWPDAALVVDGAPSMAIWREDLRGLYALLGQLGAFRQLRPWRLIPGDGRPQVCARLVARPGLPGRGSDAVATLHDPGGRRLILVVTDGVHPGWGDGTYHRTLRELGTGNPVVVVSVLPHWLWPPGGMRVTPGRVKVDAPMQANSRWRYRAVSDMPSMDRNDCPIPVLDLSPRRFGKGVGMLAGDAAWTRARLLHEGGAEAADAPESLPASGELPAFFASRMAPGAYQLLTALACIPDFLAMGVVRAVQNRLLPRTGMAELAEVLLCGVFEPPEHTFAETGDLFRFRCAAHAEALAAAAGPVQAATVRRILGEVLGDATAGNEPATAGRERADAMLLPTANVAASRVPASSDGPRHRTGADKLILRDVVCHLAAQSRARAVDILTERDLDAAGLRLLDVADLRRADDQGTTRLAELRQDAAATAVHLDNADLIARLPRLRTAVVAMISGSAQGRGPQIIILSRRPNTTAGVGVLRTLAGLLPLHLVALLGDGQQPSYSYSREYQELLRENEPVRFFRLTIAGLGQVPVAFEDRLWRQVSGSTLLERVPRNLFLDTASALSGEVRRRRRGRVGLNPHVPVDAVDLPDDFDAFLRSTL